METLEKIFGSSAKVKIMRLFIFNPSEAYDAKTIATKSKVRPQDLRRELITFAKMGLIKKKTFLADGKKKSGWTLNPAFSFLVPLENILTHLGPLNHQDLIKRISTAGKIKCIVVSGVFTKQWDGRVDILIVGDKVNKNVLQKVIRNIEAEIGKDLRYASLATSEFQYRFSIGDKLIRDIFDYPHHVIFDKVGFAW